MYYLLKIDNQHHQHENVQITRIFLTYFLFLSLSTNRYRPSFREGPWDSILGLNCWYKYDFDDKPALRVYVLGSISEYM